jgi:phage shock protein A
MASQNTPSSDQDRAAELAAALSEQKLNQLSWAASNYYQRDPIAAAVGDSPAKTVRDLFSAWGRGDAQSVALVEMLQAFDKGIQSLYIDNGNLSTELQTLRTQAAVAAQLAADNTKLRDTLSDTQTKLSASFTQIADLGVRVTHLSGQIGILSERNATLQAELATTKAAVTENGVTAALNPPQPTAKRRKSTDPDKFDASDKDIAKRQQKFEVWQYKVKAVFAQDRDYFDTEFSRIVHCSELLSGPAFDAISTGLQTVIDNENDCTKWAWKSLSGFLQSLSSSYVVISAKQQARDKLDTMHQRGQSFQEWSAVVFPLLDKAGKTDEQKVEFLRKRINSKLQDALATHVDRPADDEWDKWVDLVRKLARNLDERDHNLKLKDNTNTGGSQHYRTNRDITSDSPTVDADGDIDMRAFGISAQEWRRRKDNNLCLACGEPGHVKNDHRGPNGIPMPPRGRGGYENTTRGGRGGYGNTTRGRGIYNNPPLTRSYSPPSHNASRGSVYGRGRYSYPSQGSRQVQQQGTAVPYQSAYQGPQFTQLRNIEPGFEDDASTSTVDSNPQIQPTSHPSTTDSLKGRPLE